MKEYRVLLSRVAIRFLDGLDDRSAHRIKDSLRALEDNPFQSRAKADIKQLSGSFKPIFYRLRVGDYRAIYIVEDHEVKVTEIMPRSKGYEWLE